MSQKWKVICIIWVVCGVAILTQAPGTLWIPAIGTLLASDF